MDSFIMSVATQAELTAEYMGSMQPPSSAPMKISQAAKMMGNPQSQEQLTQEYNGASSGWENIAKNTGKSILAGTASGLQALGQTSQNIDKIWPISKIVQPALPGSALYKMLNTNVASKLNIPNTAFQNAIQGLFKEAPAAAAAVMSGGSSTLTEAAAQIVAQAGIGGALHPANPGTGALGGALGQLGGEALNAVAGATAVGAMKNSVSRLVPFAKNLMGKAKEGYQVLDRIGNQPLIEPSGGNLATFQKYSGIMDPKQAADHIQAIKDQAQENYGDIPGMKETIDSALPNYAQSVRSKINPTLLSQFEDNNPMTQYFKEGHPARKSFNTFLQLPSGKNASDLLTQLSQGRTGQSVDRAADSILSDMRDQIKDNIVSPGVGKYGTAADIDQYSQADNFYRQFKTFFGKTPEIENLANGNVSINTLNPNSYFNILKNVKETGAFNPTGQDALNGIQTSPMSEYNAMESKIHPQSLLQHALANKYIGGAINLANRFSPLGRAALFAKQGMSPQG